MPQSRTDYRSTTVRNSWLEAARRLLRHVAAIAAENPNIWQRVDEVRAARSHDSACWPSWCFLPLSELINLGREFPAITKKISRFEGLAAWRPTQGIYVFDPLLVHELSRTVTNQPIPGDVLLQMPEWCIYITVAKGTLATWGLRGYFAFLSYDDLRRQPALRFLLDMDDGSLLATFPIGLNSGSIAGSVDEACREAAHVLSVADEQAALHDLLTIDFTRYSSVLVQLVDLVLYVCTENADLLDHRGSANTPHRPAAVRTRKGTRLFPPQEVAIFEVGSRVAAAIRAAREQTPTAASKGSSIRPHVRRAHWHTYWTGSRSGPAARSVRVRWLPPILVNAKEADGASGVRIIHQKLSSVSSWSASATGPNHPSSED